MDRLRGVAVLLVIVWHAVSIPTFFGQPMPTIVVEINDALSPYRIPALLVLSGMLLDRSLRKPLGRYYWGKVANIVWPLLVWSSIQLLGNPALDGTSVAYWIGGSSYLWYLVVVGFCYAIGPIVRWVPAVVVAAALILLAAFSTVTNTTVVMIFENAPYFFIGVVLQPFMGRLLRSPGWLVTIGGALAAIWAVINSLTLGYAPRIHPIGLPMSIIGILCVAWLLNRVPRVPPLEWVGRHSLVFYVAHFPVMVIACALGAAVLPALSAYGVLMLSGIGVSAVLARYLAGSLLFSLPVPGTPTWARLSGMLSPTRRSS